MIVFAAGVATGIALTLLSILGLVWLASGVADETHYDTTDQLAL